MPVLAPPALRLSPVARRGGAGASRLGPLVLVAGLVAALTCAAACAPAGGRGARAVRFSSPLIGGAGLPSGGPGLAALDETDGAEANGRWLAARDEDAEGPERGDRRGRSRGDARPGGKRSASIASAGASAGTGARARPAPLPVRTERNAPKAPVTLGDKADPMEPRSWVGARDDSDPMVAVLELCRRRYPRCPTELPELPDADAAEAGQGAAPAGEARWLAATTPFSVGDLLLFDRVGLDNKEQLVALVTARQVRGVFEIAYLAAGVWRRGLIDPARPRLHRDREGRVVNTFLRHRRAGVPKGTRFLSGELLIGVLPLPRERAAPRVAVHP